eukprot:1139159-Pelagomonas_calceolata.AAC.2
MLIMILVHWDCMLLETHQTHTSFPVTLWCVEAEQFPGWARIGDCHRWGGRWKSPNIWMRGNCVGHQKECHWRQSSSSAGRPVTTAAPAVATPGCKHLSFRSTNNREGEAAIVKAHQPPTPQHERHLPPAAGAAVPGQNTGGAVKKDKTASASQETRARGREIAQAIKVRWGPSQEAPFSLQLSCPRMQGSSEVSKACPSITCNL